MDQDRPERDAALQAFDAFDPERLKAPHEGWKLLREAAPVHEVRIGDTGRSVFLVTRKREIKQVVERPDLFSSSDGALAPVFRWGNFEPELLRRFRQSGRSPVHTLVTADPPDAQRFRRVAEGFFTKRNVDRLEPAIAEIVERLCDAIPEGEAFNFVDYFSVPLPLEVICFILGLPFSEAEALRRYTDEFTHLVDPAHDEARAIRALETVVPGYRHLAEQVEARRVRPTDDLLTAYANARHPDGTLFDLDEAVSMAHVTVIGGNETTRNALSTAALYLARRRDLWERLKGDAALIPGFVEEVVRLGAPSAAMPRAVRQETELGGVKLPRGACLFLLWGSGSRDETVFDDPEAIDLDRPNKRAHTSFGLGLHHCVGSMLARREMIIAVRHWLARFRSFELAVAPEAVEYLPSFAFRALEDLPIIVR